MAKPFQPTPHPVLGLPTPAQAFALGETRWRETMIRREEIIRQEKVEPFTHCWEPSIWRVADAIMGFPWVDAQWALQMREHLGFSRPAPVLLVNGGNRGGKSQWASHRTMRILQLRKSARAWALHSTMPMSRQYQQPLFYGYLPASLRGKDIKSKTTYIAYKQKTGFSEEQFVLPPMEPGAAGSDCVFKSYDQDRTGIEGGNLEIVWPDELVPADWIETLEFRIAEKNGWMPITFTPVNGYNDTVSLFQTGAEVVKESTAFLIPKDGGEPDVARALGLTPEELAEVAAAQREGRASLFPQCRPQNCDEWLTGGTGQAAVPEGREFETVPRVMKCVDEKGKRAVVFFYSSDNPYGNPKEIWNFLSGKPADFVKERFYGFATKQQAGRFPKFALKVHVVDPSEIPALGTNYQQVDPCSGRNFYMLWFRVTPEHVYVYREWPGPFYIRGAGVLGPWALPDPKKADGKQGPAQATLGWGLRDYKRAIAEIEQWKGVLEIINAGEPSNEQIDSWNEHDGAEEVIQNRKIDARFASTPHVDKDRPTTLITDAEEINLFFDAARGDDIAHGIQKINDLLNYNDEKPVDYFNKPRLLISKDCPNLIFALQTWTGKDGQKGASKDPIETLYRFATDDCPYLGDQSDQAEEDESQEERDWAPTPKRYY